MQQSNERRHPPFSMKFDQQRFRRIIADQEIVVHCHHYNTRLQRIVEEASHVDGKRIFVETTEEIFANYVKSIIKKNDSLAEKWRKAVQLYAHLGFGILDISKLEQGIIDASDSHFVEGWKVGFQGCDAKICSFTEGFLQGAVYAIEGKAVTCKEHQCLISNAPCCRFVLSDERNTPFPHHEKKNLDVKSTAHQPYQTSKTVDEEKIVSAIVEMPFYGDHNGLIPAFNVYLANMPADFYSLLCYTFVKSMEEIEMHTTAKKLLVYAGEICALNTLRGIRVSEEWAQLIKPMLAEDADTLHGLVAITNALGWGNWHVMEHIGGEKLIMESLNGYEAVGHLKYQGFDSDGYCFMLTGVAAGIMALMYSDGTVDERVGTFYSEEKTCLCSNHSSCQFHVEAL